MSCAWTYKCEEAFDEIKKLLSTSLILKSSDFSKAFLLQVDASQRGVRAIRLQEDEKGFA